MKLGGGTCPPVLPPSPGSYAYVYVKHSTMVKFDVPMIKLDGCTIARAIREILSFTEYIGDGHNVGHMGSVKLATFGLSVVKVLLSSSHTPKRKKQEQIIFWVQLPTQKRAHGLPAGVPAAWPLTALRRLYGVQQMEIK